MLEFVEQYQDYSIATPKSKTTKLLEKIDNMATVYESGNNWKIGSGILATPGLIGLILGGSLGLNPLIGLAFLCGTSGAIAAWISYVFAEATEVRALPKLGLYTGDHDLLPQLTGLENTHYLALERFGIDFVELIEAKGWLPQLLTAIKDIDLSMVPDDQHDRYHHRCMQKIREVYLLSAAPEIQQCTTPQMPQAHPQRALEPNPVRDSVGAIEPSYFDWTTITRRPHLFVLGDTGSGKTSLVQWLIKNHCPQGSEVLVLDPHDRAGVWGDFPTIGRGRNFDAVELALENLVTEMDRRYASGSYDHPPKIVIIEEIPAIAANCKTAMSSIACLTLEARKVGIFLILLSQGWEVDSLGLKGKGSVRKSFLFISLGEFAIEKAKELGLTQLIRQHDRPCFVGDAVAIIPDLSTGIPAPSVVDRLNSLLHQTPAPEPTIPTASMSTSSKIDLLSDSELEDLLEKVLAYAKRKERVRPSDVSAGVQSCRGFSSPEILQLFNYLEEAGQGIIRDGKFIPN